MLKNRKRKSQGKRKRMNPHLELYSHLEEGRIPPAVMGSLSLALNNCLPAVLALPEGPVPVLSGLEEVEISIVDDDSIRDVHARFWMTPLKRTSSPSLMETDLEKSSSAMIPPFARRWNTTNPFAGNSSGTWCMACCICTVTSTRSQRKESGCSPIRNLWWENSDRNLRACLFRIMPERQPERRFYGYGLAKPRASLLLSFHAMRP